MNFIGLIFLLFTHFLSGYGLLKIFRIELKPLHIFSLSMITGVVICSMLPMILQFFYIPITLWSVVLSIIIATLLLNISVIRKFKRTQFHFSNKLLPALFELPFLFVLTIFILVSVWRCFYWPPVARDILSGPEAIAQYAVKEHTLLNSVFTLDLSTTNNHLKPPFITDLQIVYKLLVCQFGSLWLSVMFISFIIWVYALLKEKLHPIIAGIVLFVFIAMPDVYSYSYIILFDYCNMILFFSGFYFLVLYTNNKRLNYFLFAGLLFGFATFIRSETLVLVVLIVPLLCYYFWKERVSVCKMLGRTGIFVFIPFLFYYIWIGIFIKYYMPVSFNVSNQINPYLSDISLFFYRINDINNRLLFSDITIFIYGYFIYFFMSILLIDVIFFRRINKEGSIALYGIAVVYFGLALLGYLIPWVDLLNTTKRGLYKMLPLMLLYMRNSPLLGMLSARITKWEKQIINADKYLPLRQNQKKK